MKSVNKVILLGNLTRDPELRYTEHSKAVCAFGLATNRNWTTETGQKQEEPEYHRILHGRSWLEPVISISRKGERSTLRAGYTPGPTQPRAAQRKQ